MTDAEFRRRIAYYIREARERRGLSRPQLAERVGVGRGAVSDWESTKTLPSLVHLGAICRALQLNPSLFADPPEIPPNPIESYLMDAAVDAALAEPPAADRLAGPSSPRRSHKPAR